MTGNDHEHSEAVIQAAQWLAEQNPAPTPIIPAIRERFGLNALEACEAAAMSNKYKVWQADALSPDGAFEGGHH